MNHWLISTLQTVRDKSLDALDFVRKDLSEFTTTVKSDTETYVGKLASQPVGNFGVSGSSKENRTQRMDASTSLHRLQHDESTYLTQPSPVEAYEAWQQTHEFDVETRKGDIAQLLITAPRVRSIYARLVPTCTTHSDFWSRYYFRVYQLEQEDAKRLQLLKRAHEICSENNDQTADTLEKDWDEPDEERAGETVEAHPLPASDRPETAPAENATRTVPNEFDDEWESWS